MALVETQVNPTMEHPMTPRAPAFQFYPRDFLSDPKVMVMTLEQRGAYITLLCIEWLDGPLPSRPDLLRRLLGVDEESMARIWAELRPCFTQTDDGWIQKRLEKVRQDQEAYSESQAAKGRKSGKARRAKRTGVPVGSNPARTQSNSASASAPASASSSASASKPARARAAPWGEILDRPEFNALSMKLEFRQLWKRYWTQLSSKKISERTIVEHFRAAHAHPEVFMECLQDAVDGSWQLIPWRKRLKESKNRANGRPDERMAWLDKYKDQSEDGEAARSPEWGLPDL